MTRDEFDQYVRTHGGYGIRVRLLRTDLGGRPTPLLGGQEYRANWSLEPPDPHQQFGGPIFIDVATLAPGEACSARMVLLYPELREVLRDINVGTGLTAFEGNRAVASAVVTEVLPPDPDAALAAGIRPWLNSSDESVVRFAPLAAGIPTAVALVIGVWALASGDTGLGLACLGLASLGAVTTLVNIRLRRRMLGRDGREA